MGELPANAAMDIDGESENAEPSVRAIKMKTGIPGPRRRLRWSG